MENLENLYITHMLKQKEELGSLYKCTNVLISIVILLAPFFNCNNYVHSENT